jgi:indole-3-acetate monooxygenase
MTTIPATLSTATVLDRTRAIARTLGDRAPDIEAHRRLPPDLLDELMAAGCFRILLPRSHGGVQGTLADALELYEALANGDASTAWTVGIGSSGWCDLAGLPRATFDALFSPAADVIVAGVFAPSGSLTPVDGGYSLEGRWAFASGCEHATCIYVNAVEGFDGDGHPAMRISVLDPGDVTIEDTWRVAGLRGTGSHHIRVDGAVVPADRTLVPLADPPCVDVPIVHIPTPALFSLAVTAVALGTARGALDDVLEVAGGKVPLLAAGPLAGDPGFQHDLAWADAALGAGRSLVYELAHQLWDRAVAGTPIAPEDRARIRAGATWVTDTALRVGEFAYRAGGGGALYDDSPLQRRLRDLYAVTQHFLVRRDSLTAAGSVLAGQGIPVPVF